MKSKERIVPILPRDMSNIQREGVAAPGSAFTPGTLVVRKDGKLIACNLADADGPTAALCAIAPVEIVWTDGSTRVDVERIELDGTKTEQYTTLAFDFMAEVDVTLFTATPLEGEFLTKSSTAGKMDPLTLAELNALGGAEVDSRHLVVGSVIGAGSKPGKYTVRFRL